MSHSILVVDDDANIRLLYKQALGIAGYLVQTAATGKEAVEKYGSQKYDLTVLDIEMPDISGLELLAELRKLSPDTPIVLNSAYSTYKADFKSWLADAYVVKSSDLEPLKTEIKNILQQHGHPQ